MRLGLRVPALSLVASLGCATPRPQVTPPTRGEVRDAGPADVRVIDQQAVDVPVVAAHLRVRERLGDVAEIPPEEAAWLPSRVLAAVSMHTGALPSPTPPRSEEGRFTWSLVAAPEGRSLAHACESALFATDRRLVCEVDTVQWSGAERERVVVGWRGTSTRPAVGLAQPLRALGRLGAGLCLVSAQRTLRTVDLTVRASGHESIGRALAALTVAPGMSGLMLVRVERVGDGVQALLSWPSDRVGEVPADLGDDLWPARCEGASRVGAAVASATLPTLHALIPGARARGAVLAAGRQQWFVTEGDRVGDLVVRAVEATRVLLTRGSRTITLRLAAPTR